MFEIILGIVLCVVMGKIASADDESPVIWGLVTFAMCIGVVFLLPSWPFIRLLVAGAVSFGLMIGYKMLNEK